MSEAEEAFEALIEELAEIAGECYLTCIHRQHMSHEEAMQEVVRGVLSAYKDGFTH